MRQYRVRWTELHEVNVEADTEDEAVDRAYLVDRDITLKSQSLEEIEFVEGYCEEHGITLEKDENCSSCSWADSDIDMARGK